jgi:hypothetical protein
MQKQILSRQKKGAASIMLFSSLISKTPPQAKSGHDEASPLRPHSKSGCKWKNACYNQRETRHN